ncbi:MAG: nitrogenase component 1 [Saccharofermentans sp.]|nr:nitrogenase component 1 [Saccharofermentans sp.]
MNKVYKILPVYTGDVSGAASALYELGGMTVIHDPSGCNSTYNTHDEVRWYDKESLIYISGLNDIDAITGNDDKFIEDICYAAGKMKPKFIALANSPLPYLNGTDFKGITRILEKKTGLPCFYIKTNAMHDYSKGVSEAFLSFAKRMLEPAEKTAGINIVGATPLDLTNTVFEGEINANIAYGTDLESVLKAPGASLNVAVTSAGIGMCEYMKERFGIPYVCGLPWDSEYKDYRDVRRGSSKRYIVGEPVISGSIAARLKVLTGKDYNVVATTEITEGLLLPCDKKCHGEEEIQRALADAEQIIADPLFRLIAPKDVKFTELPHFAMSGRLYRKRIPNLMNMEEYIHES